MIKFLRFPLVLALLIVFFPLFLSGQNFIRFEKLKEKIPFQNINAAQAQEEADILLKVYGLFTASELSESTLNYLLMAYLYAEKSVEKESNQLRNQLKFKIMGRLLVFYQLYFDELQSFTPDKSKFFQLFSTQKEAFKSFETLESQEHEKIYQWLKDHLKNNLPQVEKDFPPYDFYLLQADLAQSEKNIPGAIRWLKKALAIKTSPSLIIELAQQYFDSKNSLQAKKLLTPLLAQSFFWKSYLESNLEYLKEENEIIQLEKKLLTKPDKTPIEQRLRLASLYRRNNQAAKSLDLLKKSSAPERQSFDYLKEKALSEFALGNLNVSEIALFKALKLKPADLDLTGLQLILSLRNFLFTLQKDKNPDYPEIRKEIETKSLLVFKKNPAKNKVILLLLDWIFSGQTLNQRESDIQELAKSYPASQEALFLQAALALYQKNTSKAFQVLKAVEIKNLESQEALDSLTTRLEVELNLLLQKPDPKALQAFADKLKIFSHQPEKRLLLVHANTLLSLALFSRSNPSDFSSINALYEKAYSLSTGDSKENLELNAMLRNNLGILYTKLGNLKLAFEFFKSARGLQPNLLAPHLNLIITLHLNNETPGALNYLESLLKDFSFKDSWENLFTLYWKSILASSQKENKIDKNEISAFLSNNKDLIQKISSGNFSTQLLTSGYFAINPTFLLRSGFETPLILSQQILFLLSPPANSIKIEEFIDK